MVVADVSIRRFVTSEKILVKPVHELSLREKGGQITGSISAKDREGNVYALTVRRNKHLPLDFSVIVSVELDGKQFRLRRYNGNSHSHRNRIEGTRIEGYHIHEATERYQQKGMQEDGFARSTDQYADWNTALRVAARENNFIEPAEQGQTRLPL